MPIKDDRIELVIADCRITASSGQRAMWELATGLSLARFRVEVWLSGAPAVDPLAEALAERSIPVARLGASGPKMGLLGFFGLWRRVRRSRPALVHLHEPWSSRLAGTLIEAAGDAHLVVSQAVVEPESLDSRAVDSSVLARADIVTTHSTENADVLVRAHGVARDRVRIVTEGVDVPDTEREVQSSRPLRDRAGAGPLRPLWVCPERLDPGAGHDVLLEALARVHSRRIPFVTVWTGDGPMRATLEQKARSLGLAAHTRFLAEGSDSLPWLGAADLVILPSTSRRTSGALLAALARARPVIASAGGIAPDLVENGSTGLLVTPGDPMALAEALERLARRPDLAHRMGCAAGQVVREERSWSRVVESFEAVYDEVLGLATFVPEAAPAHARR